MEPLTVRSFKPGAAVGLSFQATFASAATTLTTGAAPRVTLYFFAVIIVLTLACNAVTDFPRSAEVVALVALEFG